MLIYICITGYSSEGVYLFYNGKLSGRLSQNCSLDQECCVTMKFNADAYGEL